MKNTRRASLAPTVRIVQLTALVAGLGAFAAGCGGKTPSAPPVVKVADLSKTDPEVVALIEDHVTRAEADLNNFVARGELGLTYEANKMFAEAEKTYAQAAEMAANDPEAEDKVDQQWRYREAIMKRRNGDLDGAVSMMREVSKAYTRSDFIWIRLGDFLAEAGELGEAEEAFKRAMELAPQNAYGAERLGRLYVSTDRAEDAVTLLEEVVQTSPNYAAGHYALGQAYQALGRTDEAKVELQLGVDSVPGYPVDPHTGKLQTLVAGFGQRMGQAERFLMAREPDKAIELLDEIVKDKPEDMFVLNLLARAHMGKGDTATALEWGQKGLDAHPNSAQSHLTMSELHMFAGNTDEAIALAEKAAELAPELGLADYRKGEALLKAQRLEEAVESMLLAEEKGYQDPGMFLQLAQAYGFQQLFAESFKYSKLAAEKLPNNPMAQLTLVQSAMAMSDLETAREALEAAKKVAPYDASVIQLENMLKQMDQGQ